MTGNDLAQEDRGRHPTMEPRVMEGTGLYDHLNNGFRSFNLEGPRRH
jgi:hypothetical protein